MFLFLGGFNKMKVEIVKPLNENFSNEFENLLTLKAQSLEGFVLSNTLLIEFEKNNDEIILILKGYFSDGQIIIKKVLANINEAIDFIEELSKEHTNKIDVILEKKSKKSQSKEKGKIKNTSVYEPALYTFAKKIIVPVLMFALLINVIIDTDWIKGYLEYYKTNSFKVDSNSLLIIITGIFYLVSVIIFIIRGFKYKKDEKRKMVVSLFVIAILMIIQTFSLNKVISGEHFILPTLQEKITENISIKYYTSLFLAAFGIILLSLKANKVKKFESNKEEEKPILVEIPESIKKFSDNIKKANVFVFIFNVVIGIILGYIITTRLFFQFESIYNLYKLNPDFIQLLSTMITQLDFITLNFIFLFVILVAIIIFVIINISSLVKKVNIQKKNLYFSFLFLGCIYITISFLKKFPIYLGQVHNDITNYNPMAVLQIILTAVLFIINYVSIYSDEYVLAKKVNRYAMLKKNVIKVPSLAQIISLVSIAIIPLLFIFISLSFLTMTFLIEKSISGFDLIKYSFTDLILEIENAKLLTNIVLAKVFYIVIVVMIVLYILNNIIAYMKDSKGTKENIVITFIIFVLCLGIYLIASGVPAQLSENEWELALNKEIYSTETLGLLISSITLFIGNIISGIILNRMRPKKHSSFGIFTLMNKYFKFLIIPIAGVLAVVYFEKRSNLTLDTIKIDIAYIFICGMLINMGILINFITSIIKEKLQMTKVLSIFILSMIVEIIVIYIKFSRLSENKLSLEMFTEPYSLLFIACLILITLLSGKVFVEKIILKR